MTSCTSLPHLLHSSHTPRLAFLPALQHCARVSTLAVYSVLKLVFPDVSKERSLPFSISSYNSYLTSKCLLVTSLRYQCPHPQLCISIICFASFFRNHLTQSIPYLFTLLMLILWYRKFFFPFFEVYLFRGCVSGSVS